MKMSMSKIAQEKQKQYIFQYNSRVNNPELKINEKILRGYLKLNKIKTINDLDPKNIIDWLQEGGLNKLKGIKRQNFEFFTYKIELLIKKGFNNPGFYNEKRSNSWWFYLCEIPEEKGEGNEYVYYRVLDKKRFFNSRILLNDFINELNFDTSTKNKRELFSVLKPFIERYGYFIGKPDESFRSSSYWQSNDFIERFVGEYWLLKKLIEEKYKLNSGVFSKNLIEPSLKSKNYWQWFEDFGRQFHSIPADRFLEYSSFKPIYSMAFQSRKNRQAKFIGDFFPQPINLLYKYIFSDEFETWGTCEHCCIYFKKSQKNQRCCSSHHSKLARDSRYKQKKRDR